MFRTDKFDRYVKQTEVLTRTTHGTRLATCCLHEGRYTVPRYKSQNLPLFHYRIYQFQTFELFCSCLRGHCCSVAGAVAGRSIQTGTNNDRPGNSSDVGGILRMGSPHSGTRSYDESLTSMSARCEGGNWG